MISGLSNTPAQQPQQAQQAATGAPQQPSPAAQSTGLFGARGRPFLGAAHQSEALQKTVAVTTEWMKANNATDVGVIAVDGQANDLLMGAVAIALPYTDTTGKKWLVTTTLMIEATMAPGADLNRDMSYASRNYVITAMPSDAFTPHYIKKVSTNVKARYAADYTFLHAGHILVPRETSYENLEVLHNLIQSASEAIANAIEFTCNELVRDMPTITELVSGRTLTSKLDFNPATHVGLNGLPVRSEMAATLSTRSQGENLDVLNNGNNQPILTVHGFVDVLYTDMDAVEQQAAAMNPQLAFRRFVGQYVISDVVAPNGAYGQETLFQSVFTAMQFGENSNWWMGFSNAHGGNRGRDIGCLPLELTGPEGLQQPAIDTRAANFDDTAFYRYMQAMFKPGLMIAMDIEDAGHLAWLSAILRNAQPGTKEHRMLVGAAHRFTNKEFPLDFNAPFTRNEGRRTLLGYYPDQNGTRKDIRCYDDYLTMLTKFGATDIGLVRMFDQTTVASASQPEDVRIADRKVIVERGVGTDVRYVGKAERHVFTEQFLSVYAAACTRAGLRIQPSNTITINHSGPVRRGGGAYNGQLHQGGAQFFNQGTTANGQPMFGGATPSTGWSF